MDWGALELFFSDTFSNHLYMHKEVQPFDMSVDSLVIFHVGVDFRGTAGGLRCARRHQARQRP